SLLVKNHTIHARNLLPDSSPAGGIDSDMGGLPSSMTYGYVCQFTASAPRNCYLRRNSGIPQPLNWFRKCSPEAAPAGLAPRPYLDLSGRHRPSVTTRCARTGV